MRALFALIVSMLAAGNAAAQAYPSKPIAFVIPFAAGGDSDLSGRNVAQHAQKYLNNQPIVSVNRVGASGTIAAAAVRAAPADTEKFVREQYELYDKLVGALGIRQ